MFAVPTTSARIARIPEKDASNLFFGIGKAYGPYNEFIDEYRYYPEGTLMETGLDLQLGGEYRLMNRMSLQILCHGLSGFGLEGGLKYNLSNRNRAFFTLESGSGINFPYDNNPYYSVEDYGIGYYVYLGALFEKGISDRIYIGTRTAAYHVGSGDFTTLFPLVAGFVVLNINEKSGFYLTIPIVFVEDDESLDRAFRIEYGLSYITTFKM